MSTAVKKKVKKKPDVAELRYMAEKELKELLTQHKKLLNPERKSPEIKKCIEKLTNLESMVTKLIREIEKLDVGSHLIEYYYDLIDAISETLYWLRDYGYLNHDNMDFRIMTYEEWKEENGF